MAQGRDTVLACSALKGAYRQALLPPETPAGAGRFVYLRADPAVIAARLALRQGHFMPPALLPDQLAALEEPTDALVVDAASSPAAIVKEIRARLPR